MKRLIKQYNKNFYKKSTVAPEEYAHWKNVVKDDVNETIELYFDYYNFNENEIEYFVGYLMDNYDFNKGYKTYDDDDVFVLIEDYIGYNEEDNEC